MKASLISIGFSYTFFFIFFLFDSIPKEGISKELERSVISVPTGRWDKRIIEIIDLLRFAYCKKLIAFFFSAR